MEGMNPEEITPKKARDVSPSKKEPLISSSNSLTPNTDSDADINMPRTNSALQDVARIEAKYSHKSHLVGDSAKGKSLSKRPLRGFTSASYEEFSRSSKGLFLSLTAIFVYVVIGTISFGVWMDEWNAADALYYTVATFTTVGYGDLSPQTPGQRLFGILFISVGIAVLGGVALGIVFDSLFETFENVTKQSLDNTQSTLMKKFKMKTNFGINTARVEEKEVSDGEVEVTYTDTNEKVKQRRLYRRIAATIVKYAALIIIGIFVPALIIGAVEGWSFVDSIYYATVTATTVGYGDLFPTQNSTRLIAVFYMPICITVMAKLFSEWTGIYLKARAEEAQKDFLSRKLTIEDLIEMDNNDVEGGDGQVSYGEFLEFMLMAMNKVDKDDIKKINDLYNALDQDHDGILTWRDLSKVYNDRRAEGGSR